MTIRSISGISYEPEFTIAMSQKFPAFNTLNSFNTFNIFKDDGKYVTQVIKAIAWAGVLTAVIILS